MDNDAPIGIFDSGLGGLSVWRETRATLPRERIVCLADRARLPYGPRPAGEVRAFTLRGVERLLREGCKLVALACNTASAAALYEARNRWPALRVVGMEPAVKPAALSSRARRIAVLATPGTFAGEPYRKVVEAYADGVEVLTRTCPGLVEMIEDGRLETPAGTAALRAWLEPIRDAGADGLVLGCTHYSFAREQIERILEGRMAVIDPAPAVARRIAQVLAEEGLEASGRRAADDRLLVTGGDTQAAFAQARRLAGFGGSCETAELPGAADATETQAWQQADAAGRPAGSVRGIREGDAR
jgi:glutamate racemase